MKEKNWYTCEMGVVAYDEALSFQKSLVNAVSEKKIENGIVLMLEHPLVFTLGKRGGRENIVVSDDFLKEKSVSVIETERGGDITCHGPGQLTVYFIIPLEKYRIKIVDFVRDVEEVMIKTSKNAGVNAERNALNHGIWVGDKKLGSIGLAVRKGVTFHGLALNVVNDVTPFTWINPCGLNGVQMTTLKDSGSINIDMETAKKTLLTHIREIFNVATIAVEVEDLSEQFCK